MNTNPYMDMPALHGMRMPGIYCRGENIPADPNNATWQEYQTFVAEGGKPLPFDEALAWNGKAWGIDPVKQAAQLEAARAGALLAIEQFHAETVQRLVGNPTQVEKDTWALKLEVASAITAKTPVNATGQAFLASAGLADAAEQTTWAESALKKSAGYAQVVGLAERLRDTAKTAVKAAKDAAALAAALDAQRAAAEATIAKLKAGA